MTATGAPVVHFSSHEGFASIALDRPKVNAYEIGFMRQLREAVAAAETDARVAVVILRSALPTVFSVGADIKAWAANDVAGNQRLVDAARACAGAIDASHKVYLAAINGHALGGGLELALACDLRYAAAGDYQLGLPEVKLGLMPGNGGTQRLLRLVGRTRALELVATGHSIDPQRALADGLVDRVVPAADLERECEAFAHSLTEGPSQAVAAIKTAIRDGAERTLEDALALEAELSDQLYDTADAREGFAAYVERRAPDFRAGGHDRDR